VEWWEWLATEFSIRDRQGRLTRLLPNAAQKEYTRKRGPRNIILKARQLGMTTWIAARFFAKTVIVPGTVTLQVAHTLESAQQIFRIVLRFLHHLPPVLARAVRTSRANVRELAFAHNDSRYIVDTAGNEHAGRGLTIHNLHASEVAMWPRSPRDTMAALLAAVPPDGCVDIESTPHGAGGYFHELWLRNSAFRIHDSEFTPHFFPWWLESSYRLPLLPGEDLSPFSVEEDRLREAANLSGKQIKFRRQLRARFGHLAPQEFAENPADCFLVSGRPVFDVTAIDARLRELSAGADRPYPLEPSTPDFQFPVSSFPLLEWFPPQPGRHYVIGADVAGGASPAGRGDFSAAVVLDMDTGLQCAEIFAQWPIGRFAQELARLGTRYNTALLAVERNNQGHAVLYALHNEFAYPRLYRHATQSGAFELGWLTNAQTKPQAIGVLGRMLREAPSAFLSRRLLEQCRGYSYLKDGESGALPGMHDDLVMAAAIAFTVRATGGDLQLASVKW
jgi:hypothetical protein